MEELSDFCARNGYDEFASYAREASVQNILMELTETLIRERPQRPKEFLAQKLQDELPPVAPVEAASIPIHQMIRLFEGTRNIAAEIVPKETINVIIHETIRLLNCDRVSVFVYNSRIGMLLLTASNLTKPIRVNPGQGIAGYVFTTKTQVNIPDCYQDSRFDQKFDKMTGYYTKSMIVVPIVDHENNALGVLQAINKSSRPAYIKLKENEEATYEAFNETDMMILDHLTQLVGVALRNAEIYREAIIASERSQGLLAMLSSLSQDLGAQSTILTITLYAQQLVLADSCFCFTIDGRKEEMWGITADTNKEVRLSKKGNIIGDCAIEKKMMIVDEAHDDSRITKVIRDMVGAHIETMLCLPIICSAKAIAPSVGDMISQPGIESTPARTRQSHVTMTQGEEIVVLGVIVMINKREFDDEVAAFSDEDVAVVDKFAKFVGESLANSQYIRDSVLAAPIKSEGSAVFGLPKKIPKRKKVCKSSTVIEEDDESDDEEEEINAFTRMSKEGACKRSSCPNVVGQRLSYRGL
eukprot:GEMP01013210.1.p1 GENE.GEMP01013210.1~~GEMP01013210.1.p1  ORF type:complete len:527 (+),score=113.41 GEMP01013210.1:547-2127(+)